MNNATQLSAVPEKTDEENRVLAQSQDAVDGLRSVSRSIPRASTRAGPGRIVSSRTYIENRSVAGSRPSASHRARTSTIRSRSWSGGRNT